MKLPATGREYYALKIITDPDVGPWEASFDGGQTWQTATMDGDFHTWLVNGPDFVADDTPSMTIPDTTRPVLRVVDQPEVLVRTAPRIFVD